MAPYRKTRTADRTPIPAYYKLQMELLHGIEGGRWVPEGAIPAERKLAESYGVSLGTVNRAIMNLVREGYLYRIQGKGTFVAGTAIQKESVRYTRLREDFKGIDPVFQIKLLNLTVIEGRQPINKYLQVRINQKLYRLERVFWEEGNPIVYGISYLPVKMLPDLDKLPVSFFEKTTLYEALEKQYGLPTIFNQELFGIAVADEGLAEVLQIAAGRPVLCIDMLSFTYKDQPYEYRLSYFRGDNRKIFREM